MVTLLAIETSCDETAVSILNSDREILGNALWSQIEIHTKFKGVMPEMASRAHIDRIDDLTEAALSESGIKIEELDAIAVTGGPGLMGCLLVGIGFAKTLAAIYKKKFLAINHLEGHILTARFCDSSLKFPFLTLLISGGHCQIILAKAVGVYIKIGGTIDDSLGEAFDKVARILGLDYPGGPQIEEYAKKGDALKYNLPKPICNQDNCNFSFSGLKTAVKLLVEKVKKENKLNILTKENIADISASFQYTVLEILKNRLSKAFIIYKNMLDNNIENNKLIICGGVAANKYINKYLAEFANNNNFIYKVPPLKLCTDNAIMIGWAAIEKFNIGVVDDLDFDPKSRWGLDELLYNKEYNIK